MRYGSLLNKQICAEVVTTPLDLGSTTQLLLWSCEKAHVVLHGDGHQLVVIMGLLLLA